MQKISIVISILRRIFYGNLHCVVGQSQKTIQWLANNLNLKHDQLTVIPNIVLTPSLELKNLIKRNLALDTFKDEQPLITCIGRLTPQKGFDFAIQIFSIVQKKCPSAKMIIVGDGSEESDLKELVFKLRLEANITFIPRLDDLSTVFIKSDILLFPSRYEGFPNVLAEAMAHGLPAVAFDCSTGPADLIVHGFNGFLVEVGNVSTAAELTLTLLENHGLRNQFGQCAMKVAETFSPDVVGKQWFELVGRVGSNQ
jgi:glycosyltransferase involved in cell wall biosynthesis